MPTRPSRSSRASHSSRASGKASRKGRPGARKSRAQAPAHRAGAKPAAPAADNRWSKRVMETSDALDLEPGAFKHEDPAAIARSLRRSAEASDRRKTDAFRSAMSMLNFYINRAGRNLPETSKARLEAAKQELRKLYGK